MRKIIDGSTQLLGIVGDPIEQVRAPEVWSALFRANGFNAVCVPLHVKPAELKTALRSLQTIRNLAGLIVTIPHKLAAVHHADIHTDRARRVQSVNVMRRDDQGRWHADILDGVGFVRGLLGAGQRIEGRRALVVGAGGAGTAIAFAIAEAAAASVHVADIVTDRAHALASRLQAAGIPSGISAASARGYDLIVNASPVGMKPDDPISIDCTDLVPWALVGDVVVHPQMTPLLLTAQARGCYVQPGVVMMDNQLTEMREFFGFPQGDYSPTAVTRATSI
ncbi:MULTISPECIES: shikimate dehydrogenase [unclassified Bradyrhizobium]|uniref:shikimate dehydrogenase family protein n=1 Tax=unclassified Bradyrhizobium TaxID=2631580 RepID=UPI002479DD74|nr:MULTISPECIES: shikimate dehydrogenase [unclassified Bradyrhizobium]WGS19116.1 shikimate dehydrogenase [Bradyrhizobium sp. ISRA463]WGS25953.1 shikimate dehydrogenase [Bradyrhizobium sp. ISRA464]